MVARLVQPFRSLNVYVIGQVPTAVAVGTKFMPDVPIPLQLPPTGVPLSGTKVSLIQMRAGKVPALTTGSGLTVMVKVIGVPVQVVPPLTKLGVTVIVATTGALVVLSAVNEMLPVPEAAKPMLVVVLVQLYTVPVVAPLKVTAAVLL